MGDAAAARDEGDDGSGRPRLDPAQWSRVEQIFAELCELPGGGRGARLDELCPEGRVREEVESLLGYVGAAGLPVAEAIDVLVGALQAELDPHSVGQRVALGPNAQRVTTRSEFPQ